LNIDVIRAAVRVVQTLQMGPQDDQLQALQHDIYLAMLSQCREDNDDDPATVAYRDFLELTERRAAGHTDVDDRKYLHAAAMLAAEVQLATAANSALAQTNG
jgi:hypothetical protein